MDLHLHGYLPTPEEERALDRVLGPAPDGWSGGIRDPRRDGRSARGGLPAQLERRHLLLPALHAVQDAAGWVSPGALEAICRRLSLPPAEVWGVVSFYHLFATEPRPRTVLHVCRDLACQMHGESELASWLERELPAGSRSDLAWQPSPCLGLCERAPAALLTRAGDAPCREALAPLGFGILERLVRGADAGISPVGSEPPEQRSPIPQLGNADLRLLGRVGRVDPESLDAYRSSGGFEALARAVELGPEGVLEEVLTSRLVGRGGAAFPAGRKWEAVRRASGRVKYLVVNADESEPGTFKDRVLLEEDPFAILEAATIAAFVCGAEKGFLYLRGEYPLAERRLRNALEQLRTAGFLGSDVGGHGFAFELELRRGAGAYICGEETALFNSIEGKRGEPRSKPPFPVEVGLFGCPTAINNVETLANVPWIVLEGGAAFARIGSGSSTGTKLFCVSGAVARPGLYEVPFGIRLGELLGLAGGVAEGRTLQAVLLGGAAGSFVGSEALDLPLTFEATRSAGASLGSGVVMVFDERADLGAALATIAGFFRHESCGQCVPCRVGTVRLEEWIDRQRRGNAGDSAEEAATLRELIQAMRDASICGLGQTAPSALESALARFGRERLFANGSKTR